MGAGDLQTADVDVGAKPFGRTVPWDSGGASELDTGRATICPIPWPKPDHNERIVDKVGIPAVFRWGDLLHPRLTLRKRRLARLLQWGLADPGWSGVPRNPSEEKTMSATQATATVSMNALRPIDKAGLSALADKGKANPGNVVTLKATTICEGQFRNLTYVRNLEAHIIDEPPHLLGEDTAPNPSEATLASLGACLSVGMHANATARGINLTRLELELEGDINVTAVWGVGDVDPAKKLGFTDVRVKVHLEGDATREELEDLVAHANDWSPVANTLRNPVGVTVDLA